jgi:hypothetical protein
MAHYLNPSEKTAHVVLFYRNFQASNPHYCHVGLGVNALHTAKVLRREKVRCDVFGVWTPDHVREKLRALPSATHALIEAPWVSAAETAKLTFEFPNVHFIVRAHSQIGFLQVEPGAIKIMRELLDMQEGVLNLTVAANSHKLASFLEKTYTSPCLYLPNLYYLERAHRHRDLDHGTRQLLRISSFGALRLMKNHTTAAAAALMIAERRRCDLEFWVNVNREEHGKGVLQSLRNMFTGLPWAKLIEHPWEEWSKFRKTAGHMDLALQVSFSETFNLVSADSVAEQVPVVTSSAIEWTPSHWHADPDSVEEIARTGMMLLSDPGAGAEGLEALQKYSRNGTRRWLRYLADQPGEHRYEAGL